MVDRIRAKEEAKAVLRDNNRGTCVLALLLSALVSLALITAPASQLGLQGLYLRMSRGSRERAGAVLQGFDRFGGALLLSLWIGLWMFLWILGPLVVLSTLLGILAAVSRGLLLVVLLVPVYIVFVVICVWKGLQYAFAFFVMADNPGIPVREALRRSIDLTRGNVGAIFVAGLSFFGWIILSSFTFGILMLVHVGPYMLLTSARIYDQLSGGSPAGSYGYAPPGGGIPYTGPSGYEDGAQDGGIPYETPPHSQAHACGLKGVTGMYSGYEMDLRPDETVLVGRDGTQVHVVISSGAERVSRRHCSIRFDSQRGCYVVVDFSKNGSFREDGSRLRSNTEEYLRPGEVLYLGDQSNGFRLK